ncbi:FecR family protein [Niastella sp. OAS944]|uniref:FecR family protein n=1 Tax=Niastella sp. OAS944 TaxID=2664089 RepID=UPI0034769601|nr:ferric-dicitrate binding protein FerR (iron transport regulator) [Chitinophagaceae bacterium OAS944]
MISIEHLTDLLIKHLQGSLSQPEQEQLDHWVQQSDRNRRLFATVNDEEQIRQLVLLYASTETTGNNEAIILSKIRQGIMAAPVRKMNGLWRWSSVAAIVLVVAGAAYFIMNKGKSNTTPVVKTADIPPGRDGAILTLADGRQVVLDSMGNGIVATQNGARVTLKDGALTYDKDAGSITPVYNNLSTPKGRQFQLILPDGSKVWLNAASSLRYPTAFVGNERRVEVSGEVYFKVAKNTSMPFRITIPPPPGGGRGEPEPGAEIEVLGTQFNVNAYENETAVRTTLVEGSLKVMNLPANGNKASVVLTPGKQAVITTDSQLKVADADVDKVVAWKRGIFNFEDASLEEVMRQIERWYDIQVVYEKNVPDIKFGGKMSNDVSLQGLLKSLQESDVHFRLEGRKLIVLP